MPKLSFFNFDLDEVNQEVDVVPTLLHLAGAMDAGAHAQRHNTREEPLVSAAM
ncbi:hypothetical protein V6Z11_D08G153200 [Gossypium hirsutum]